MGWLPHEITLDENNEPHAYVRAVEDLPAGHICVADDERNAILCNGELTGQERVGSPPVTIRKGEWGWLYVGWPLLAPIASVSPTIH